jgi:GNAT superfamily N-acetyltransferase
VRAPTPADRGRWRELYAAYAAFYEVEQPDDAAEVAWSWIQDPAHDVCALVVQDPDGHLAGLAHYRAFPRPLSASVGCFLDDLFVEPAARGRGAVDALLAELRSVARREGWSVVRWITARDNARARAKYDQVATATPWVTYDMDPAGGTD